MCPLSDLMPESLKKDTFGKELRIGKIIHRYEYEITHPDNKFSIIVGMCKENGDISIARVFINSDINLHVINTEELKQLQVDILKKDYTFLSNDYSFINCSKIFDEVNYSELEQEYINNPINFFKDDISKEKLRNIIDKITNSKTIKPIHKKKYNWK